MRLAKNTLSAVSVFVIITFSISLSSPQDLNEFKKQTAVNSPLLLESIGAYNIVLYRGLFYGLPKSLGPVDWKGGKVGTLPGVVTAPTAKKARALIPNTQTPSKDEAELKQDPLLLESIGAYNIVLYRGLFYGLPKSLGPVDWKGGKVGTLPGVITAPTAKKARALIPNTQTPSKDELEPLLNALTFIGIILIGILFVRFFIRLFVRRR